MEKEKLKHHLDEATERLIEFTRTHCFNDFSANYKYLITPNVRTADTHLNDQEIAVLATWNEHEGLLLTLHEVVELFHHENKVPVWVNVSVYEARLDLTVIDLYCSRRLRHEDELMHPGFPPFHVTVAMPPGSLHNGPQAKFDVNWRKMRDDSRTLPGLS